MDWVGVEEFVDDQCQRVERVDSDGSIESVLLSSLAWPFYVNIFFFFIFFVSFVFFFSSGLLISFDLRKISHQCIILGRISAKAFLLIHSQVLL